MRILFFSHYFPPEVNAPATRTYEHCVRWARAGHDVTVVTCAPNCPDGILFAGYRNAVRSQTEHVEGVQVIRVWTYLAPNAGTFRRIGNYLSYTASAVVASIRIPRPDVVVATSPQFFCGWAGIFASRMKRVPLVLEIRDIWPESIRAVGALRNRALLGLLESLERRLYRSAGHIVTVGDGYRHQIVRKIGAKDRISVITNGVDLERFSPREPDLDLCRQWGADGKFVCSYVGTIGMAHGLEVVVEAAKMLRQKGRDDIRFWLVGDGASRRRLEESARQSGVTEMIVFPGRQPKERIPQILASSGACLIHLKQCDLFQTVIPSKIFEVMAMEKPVIMGVDGMARKIVMNAGAGIEMTPGCPRSLVRAVETLADGQELRAKTRRAGRAAIMQHFSRDALASEYLELLAQVSGVPTEKTRVLPQRDTVPRLPRAA